MDSEITRMASRDALTDMPNRSSFLEHVEQALERTQCKRGWSFALMFLDLDDLLSTP